MTMSNLSQVVLLVAVLLTAQCSSFSVVPSPGRVQTAVQHLHPAEHFQAVRPFSILQRMAEEANEEVEEEEGTGEEKSVEVTTKGPSKKEKEVSLKTKLLALPLFCKFVLVLVIKLATDLIVFPLLLLYRFARLMKRRLLKLIGKDGSSTAPPEPKEASGETP